MVVADEFKMGLARLVFIGELPDKPRCMDEISVGPKG